MDSIPTVEVDLPLDAYEYRAYQNEELLRHLYSDCYLSCAEIADMLDTYPSTISRWLNRHDIETRDWSEHVELRYYADREYSDGDLLNELYVDEEMGVKEIADIYGVTRQAITYQLKRNGIEVRNHIYDIPEFELELKMPSGEGLHGYPVWKGCDGRTIPVHQLLAVANGADPYKVFGQREYQVHHKNGCKIDNRSENIELLHWDDHGNQQHEDLKNNTTQYAIQQTILAMLNLKDIAQS